MDETITYKVLDMDSKTDKITLDGGTIGTGKLTVSASTTNEWKIRGSDPLNEHMIFNVGGKEMLRLCGNGDIYIRGVLAANDQEVVDGLRAYLGAVRK